MLYFDTSALFPYYRPEACSNKVQKLLRDPKSPICISPLVEVEFASVIARLRRMKELDEASAVAIQSALDEDTTNGCFERTLVSVEAFHLAREWLLSRKSALRTLDALHLACASLANAKLITADETLMKAAQRFGVPAMLIQP